MKLYTIGFSGKNAEQFFELLKSNGVKTLIDARLNNKSQLAGFTKVSDLPYLLKQIGNIDYMHEAILAPTKELLNGYKDKKVSWIEYEREYDKILEFRKVSQKIDISKYENACLLCSESTADMCHRRLAAEYIQRNFFDKEVKIIHL